MADKPTVADVKTAVHNAVGKIDDALASLREADRLAEAITDTDELKERLARAGFKLVESFDQDTFFAKPLTDEERASVPVTLPEYRYEAIRGLYEELCDISTRLAALQHEFDTPTGG